MTKHTDTSRSGDLVETLLCVDRGGVLHSRRPKQTHPVCAKAADRIEAIEAENERLRELISDCRGSHWLKRTEWQGSQPHLDAIWRGLVETDDTRATLGDRHDQ